MRIELVWTLLWQASAVAIVVIVLRRRFFRFTGALLLLAFVAFHALPELLLLASSKRTVYRDRLTDDQLRDWLWYVGPATALYAIVYVATLGGGRRADPADDPERTARSAGFFKWQCWVPVAAALYFISLTGSGYAAGARNSSYFQSGVSGQFLLVGVVLASFSVIHRFGHPELVLIVQSVGLLLLGQRLTVLAGVALLGFLLGRHGIRPTRRQLTLVISLVALALLTLSSARITGGRAELSGGATPTQRVEAILSGGSAIISTDTREQLLDDYVYRVDGNYFGARVLDSVSDNETRPIGIQTLINMTSLAVPSFLNPAKLDSAVSDRSEKTYIAEQLDIENDVDILPGLLAPLMSYFGPEGFFPLVAIVGAAMAAADRFLRLNSPTRTIVSVGIVNSILYYERGLEGAVLTARGIIVFVVLAQVLGAVESVASRSVGRRLTFRAR